MKSQKRSSPRNLICLIFTLSFSFVQAQEPTPLTPAEVLTKKADEITRNALRVVKEEEGVVSLALKGHHSYANKTLILFFRKKGIRMEIVAQGQVIGEKEQFMQIELNRDNIVKYPVAGDYAIPMADPRASANGKNKDNFDALVPDDDPIDEINHRPGYLEFGLGIMNGTLASTPNGSTVNGSKNTTGYRFQVTRLAYFLDPVPIGIEYDAHGGNFPTRTFYDARIVSKEAISNLSFNYRFKPLLHDHFAPILKVTSLSDTFTTSNPDENLLNTAITGLGFGLHLNYDLVSPVWKPGKKEFFMAFQNVYAEYMIYPSITAVDGDVSTGVNVSRGTSQGSSGSSYRLGFNALLYLDFVPLLKRFVISGSYGMRSYNLKFTGPTTKEATNPNPLLENGSGKESEQDYRVFIGVRFDDPLKFIFGKKEEKKP